METVIKINPAELNPGLINKIREFIGNKKNIDITISLKEFDAEYAEALNQSIDEAERGEFLSMTMEEFVAYTPQKKK